ncbi:unnamed protein product [Cuscuta epithymum]|uniref:Uncharacterized protein n=1 Tax=Cuscuta epithymum TaxID=186058 RepID=A0AAV0C7M4_9ASTE|nr:unnamed protein product [Cuscuta epithymum]CAH9140794.1 unnamed protein product [Cuscuta epithymum]
MSLLEVITKASVEKNRPEAALKYPIILNPEPVIFELKPQDLDAKDDLPVKRATGWKVSERDTEIIELGQSFFKKLKRKLKNPNTFNQDEFLKILGSYLVSIARKLGTADNNTESDKGYVGKLVGKSGLFMGRDVKGLVLEACVYLECWEVLESLMVNGLVEHSHFSSLISNLIEKNRADLIVLCVKHLSDLQANDVMCILKYFLSLPKDGHNSILSVRKEWESQALLAIQRLKECDGQSLLAIEKVKDKHLRKRLTLVRDASLLLMIAYDGFSGTDLCLHYLISSRNYDEVILGACISNLDGSEMMRFVRYLGKWLKKYDSFPDVCLCPEASSVLGLTACDWVPRLEDIIICLGLLLDEHFSTLVLHPEFHEELKSLNEIVNSLAGEARSCGKLSNLTQTLRGDTKDANLETTMEGTETEDKDIPSLSDVFVVTRTRLSKTMKSL